MGANTAENTNLRLKAVLDILAESVWSGATLNAGEVLAEAIVRVPFNDHEAELLSGGIPRGHKTLTSASAKLVKAGWLVKGRSGWTIPDDGLRATVAFPDAAAFGLALDAGTPVPADVPVPTAPPVKPAAKKAAVKRSAPKKAADPKVAATEVAEPKVAAAKVSAPKAKAATAKAAPAAKKATTRKAPAKTKAASAVETVPQPEAVAIAGDFNKILGAPEDWAPQYDEAQMEFNPIVQVWTLTAELPAGFYTYKIALNRSWDENYGAFGARDGANHELNHDGGPVTITYSHVTRDIVIG
ncbi:pullulanase X25 domain-containing protein [Paenarthrobacter aurescens]|uniref:pullulanase X25 domain-containing protein n=1 Tax=Paenarthrobacter aurescens TaxID=43663 RepID=UPI0021BE9C81|nr:glycosidase [Paenarthrobacter aurescens]MCT9868664.1 glycosidase [Paenarthrobacter aurescens]